VAVAVAAVVGKLLPGSSRSVISPSELKKLSTHESTGGRAACCCREKDGEDSEDDEISGERGVSRSTDAPDEAVGQ
jgi:hypothetical protein